MLDLFRRVEPLVDRASPRHHRSRREVASFHVEHAPVADGTLVGGHPDGADARRNDLFHGQKVGHVPNDRQLVGVVAGTRTGRFDSPTHGRPMVGSKSTSWLWVGIVIS